MNLKENATIVVTVNSYHYFLKWSDNMNEIEIILTNFEAGKTFLADEHPIVNDRDYCEVLTTPDILSYTVNGTKCHIQKVNSSKEELIKIGKFGGLI